jgi:hypothetical protein
MIDNKRTVAATLLNWKEAGYPDTGEPGQSCRYVDGHFMFACPGCGRWGGIRVGAQKPPESPSWAITEGSVDDPTTLSLSPSINCVGCCGWHGYLTKGVYKSC